MSRWHITKEEREGLMFSDWNMYDADGDFIWIIEDEPKVGQWQDYEENNNE